MRSLRAAGKIIGWFEAFSTFDRSLAFFGVRVERFVTSPLPHRPVLAAFLHTVPPFMVSLKDYCDRFLVLQVASILPSAFWSFPTTRPVYLHDGWASYGVIVWFDNSTSLAFGYWMSFHNRHNGPEALDSARLSVTASLVYACWLLSTHSFASARHSASCYWARKKKGFKSLDLRLF